MDFGVGFDDDVDVDVGVDVDVDADGNVDEDANVYVHDQVDVDVDDNHNRMVQDTEYVPPRFGITLFKYMNSQGEIIPRAPSQPSGGIYGG